MVGCIIRDKFNELRKEKGYTIKLLSEASGVNYSTLKSFFGGKTEDISHDFVALMANAFSLTYRQFMDDERFDDIDIAILYKEMKK